MRVAPAATIPPVPTAVISDLHLGALNDADMLRRPGALERLIAALEGADRVVLLGDTLELRERPVAALLELVRPLFEAARPDARRQARDARAGQPRPPAGPALARPGAAGGPAARVRERVARSPSARPTARPGVLASWLPRSEVTLAYPGLRLEDGTYATHGHYLDLYLTVPRVESIAASVVARLGGRTADCTSADDFEAVVAPIYGFHAGMAEGASGAALARGATVSRSVWSRATGDGRVGRLLVGRVTIPAAVATLNRLKIGPFSATLSGEELRRAGLLAMGAGGGRRWPPTPSTCCSATPTGPARCPATTGPSGARSSGKRLWNSGNWYLESTFVSGMAERSPYWPGTIVWLEPGRAPRIENALRGYAAAGTGADSRAAQRVGGLVELARAPAKRPGEGRPDRRVAPVAVDVVARAAAAHPDRALASSRRCSAL